MAMSLEELLAKEGFKERKSKMSARSSVHSEAASIPLYPYRGQRKSNTSSGVKKTERTQSDITQYDLRNEFPTTNRMKGRRSRGNLMRMKKMEEGSIEKSERVANYLRDVKRYNVDQPEAFLDNDTAEVGLGSGDMYKDIYSNKMYSPQINKGKYSDELAEREIQRKRSGRDIKGDKRRSMKQPEASYSRSKSIENNKNFDDSRSRRPAEVEQKSSEPALDEAAIQAVISILSGYIKRFLKDEDFRASFHHNCSASLNFAELEDLINESKVIANLEQAIEIVERAAEECASPKELKKASLQLSVITGLSSNELKDGFTSGIPNSKLSACAHLYLSVVYKLQKKDRIAAKHLLQVFCDSPFQARMTLLPELWDYMFLPHLSHLKDWYNKEVESLADTPSKLRNLKLLEKVFNDIMDSGTYQFAAYYKDWLTEGLEAPSIPSINIPSTSFQGVQQEGSSSFAVQGDHEKGSSNDSFNIGNTLGPLSPQPMVSRRLYDAVFGRSRKPGVDEVEGYKDLEIFDNILRSSDDSFVEEKQALTEQVVEREASHPEYGLSAKEAWTLHKISGPGEGHVSNKFGKSSICKENPEDEQMLRALSHTEANELSLKQLAKSVFAPTHTESIEKESNNEELQIAYDNFDEESCSSSIPQDFVCPLTGIVFEDPVTLETGQTFERAAITEWLEQGNRACPVTGKTLVCQSVPLSNFILKRVIDSWKLEHARHLLSFACQGSELQGETVLFILHQLLTAFSKEERIANAKHLIALGGLRFLQRKFQFGKLGEKSRVAEIFSYCIEVDNGCRNYIAKNIKKSCLLELIRSKQIKSRENAILLLVELICLNRREDVNLFVSALKHERILEIMHILSVHLQSSPPEKRPLVAVLLLHFDLLDEPREYSIYREEAVDAITMALDGSLSNENVRANCCRALLILGGHFSTSGKIMTEDWILKKTGFLDGPKANSLENEEADVLAEENILLDYEEQEKEDWLRRLSASLVCDGKKSFLESINQCIGSTNSDLVRVCLTTVAWLSSTLGSFSDNAFPLSAFSSLISRLKETLENGDLVEHKILASMSLFNFSKIPEFRILLKTIAKDIAVPLRNLAEVTWTARELYTMISHTGS